MAIMGVSFGFAIDRYVPDQFVNIPFPTKSHLVISTKPTEVRVELGAGDLIIPLVGQNVSKSTFSNFSCIFLNRNTFFQFQVQAFCYQKWF